MSSHQHHVASTARKKVAVIGSGAAGIAACVYLNPSYDCHLFEASNRLGGHTHTITCRDAMGKPQRVDTGFIVFNLQNYPHFVRFLSDLNVAYRPSDMSFSYAQQDPLFWYASDFPRGIFSQKRNLFSLSYWSFLRAIRTHSATILEDILAQNITTESLADYLQRRSFHPWFVHRYLLPMGAAIWSCSTAAILDYPAQPFFEFWKNHCLLTVGKRPVWQTIQHGSSSYIAAFLAQFKGTVHQQTPIKKLVQESHGVWVHTETRSDYFDHVICATHADQALQLLDTPSKKQSQLLSPWTYTKNTVYLHTDTRVLPPHRHAWASWNSVAHQEHPHTLSYYMNRLQGLNSPTHYIVTLNNTHNINPNLILKTIHYTHPFYCKKSVATHPHLTELHSPTLSFCGSYFGSGFHEDAILAGKQAAARVNKLLHA